MKTSEACKARMVHHEGLRLKPYLCPAHVWTVGVGSVLHQEQIKLPMVRKDGYDGLIRKEFPLASQYNRTWARQEVMELFDRDLGGFERGVLRLVPSVAGHQGRFDALVSLAFNIGLGNLQRSQIRIKANRGDWQGAADAFLLWTKAGGRELPGLVKRRREEREMFLADNVS